MKKRVAVYLLALICLCSVNSFADGITPIGGRTAETVSPPVKDVKSNVVIESIDRSLIPGFREFLAYFGL